MSSKYFQGKLAPSVRDENGLVVLSVCPSEMDLKCAFSDPTIRDESEYLDMLQGASDRRTARDRIEESTRDCDSCEVGVQCFDDGRWPERTDLRCWWCLHSFESRPFPCPTFMQQNGVVRIRGIFCGPSCAKAWAYSGESRIQNTATVSSLIDMLATKRGYSLHRKGVCVAIGKKRIMPYIPPAPPREVLQMFRGPDGMTIEQFRGMPALGFDVEVLYPPFVCEKQVIVAQCDRTNRIAMQGRAAHRDSPDDLMISAAECARRRKAGLEIFAGVGARRLTEYLDEKPSSSIIISAPPPLHRPIPTEKKIAKTPSIFKEEEERKDVDAKKKKKNIKKRKLVGTSAKPERKRRKKVITDYTG